MAIIVRRPSSFFYSALSIVSNMKSGGGVLLIASCQLIVGISLLGVFEGYKTHYFNSTLGTLGGESGLSEDVRTQLAAERAIFFRTPLDFLFWFSCLSCISALFGLAGIFTAQPTLVTIFFAYNLVQTVLSFNLFVDVLADKRVKLVGQAAGVTGYEQAAAAFLFIMFVLSLASAYFTTKAAAEIKQKQRESYHEMSVINDTLQFEPDLP